MIKEDEILEFLKQNPNFLDKLKNVVYTEDTARKPNVPNQKEMYEILKQRSIEIQSGIETDDEPAQFIPLERVEEDFTAPPRKQPLKDGKRPCKLTPIQAKQINFVHDHNEYNNYEKEQDKKWDNKHPLPPVSTDRPPSEQKEVRCNKCGKMEYISSGMFALIGDSFYNCNRCLGGK